MEIVMVLLVFGVVFVLPIAAWISARRSRARILDLERLIDLQSREVDVLKDLMQVLRADASGRPAAKGAATIVHPAPVPEATPAARAHEEAPATTIPPQRVEPAGPPTPIEVPSETVLIQETRPEPPVPPEPLVEEVAAVPPVEIAPRAPLFVQSAARDSFEPPPPGSVPDVEPAPGFDWEGLVGVKLFSAIAGIALVLAAVFFLRYSIESGWLQPPVRVAIGIIVAVALLITCELKAARRYPATANALDAAAIAILFSTFFASHALWNLIPSVVAFALLGLVTALAVLLSIRRESLFIAVLGLLGGFATPALLSTGENRPIPLFAYLLLLNVGLAWVAYRKRWPALTWLSLALTTIYQWGWVFRFLDTASLSLAMGIFIIFPVASIVALSLARRPAATSAQSAEDRGFERGALLSAALPVFFAVYLSAVPEYAAHPILLFGFVLLIDAGLLAVALARREELLHVTGALGTMLTCGIWIAASYEPGTAAYVAPLFAGLFSVFYLVAPEMAARIGRPLLGAAAQTQHAAALILFVFPVVAAIEPAFATNPSTLFGILLALVVFIAWRAARRAAGSIYYVAAFFAVAAQATWSATHLTIETLRTGVAVYAAFGLTMLAVPILARRYERPLQPPWGGGVVLLASVALLLFLSMGEVAPAALWAMALLLAILNAALFIESAAGGLPMISQAGSILSWVVLGTWWARAAASVGVISSLTVLTALALVTLGGHAWSVRTRADETVRDVSFANGLFLGLIGHAFLFFVALNPEWALPPWPLFASLAVITLATSAASLYAHLPMLHASGVIAAGAVIVAWASATGSPPYGSLALIASGLVSAYALGWIGIAGTRQRSRAAAAAATVLFVAEVTALVATAAGGEPPFPAVVVAHALNIALILWLTSVYRWRFVAPAAVAPAWIAVVQWQLSGGTDAHWRQLLLFASVLYALFLAYPLALGRRAAEERDPYTAAVLASGMFFFSARAAFIEGGLQWMIGAVPVVQGAALAVLLRELLHIQPEGARDTGRLALIAGASLAFVTVAIPLQLRQQWITIGWALEGAALAWLYRRIPHRGLLTWAVGLLAVVFVRLSVNPEVLLYEPRGSLRILNWYLYTYLVCAVALSTAGWWLGSTDDRVLPGLPRSSHVLPAAAVVLLFLLLNIEIADFFATGPAIAFRFGVTLQQDLTYTIGWLVFGVALLAGGIYLASRPARFASVALIAVTTFKCFLYDLGSLAGLYRVASLVGLAMSLALVAMALQKYVLSKPRGAA